MKLLNDLKIRTKLKLVIMLSSAFSIILVFAGFYIYEKITYRQLLIDDITTTGDIIAENINAALAFQNSTDAKRVLNSLSSQPHIIAAAVYDANDELFVKYTKENMNVVFPVKPDVKSYTFEDDALIAYKPIFLNQKIGTIYLKMDLIGQEERFQSYIQIAALVLISSLLITYLLALFLEKNLSAPVINLTNTVQKVSEKQDYSLRATKMTNDEIGFLADSFNNMLSEMQENYSNLKQTNEALQQAEKRYRTTLDNMMEGCQIINFNYKLIYINDAAVKQIHKSRQELVGRTIMEIYPGIEKTEFFIHLKKCLEERSAHYLENDFTYSDGSSGWFQYALEPVPEGVFILSTDITKERKLNEELIKHKEHLEDIVAERTAELKAANKELESFSYSVSHDLRAPLRHINGFTDILLKRIKNNLDEKDLRYFEHITDSTKKMGILIDELLVFSRMGRTEMKREKIDLNKLISDTISNLNQDTDGRNIKWEIEKLPEVKADPTMLQLVYQNLIGNALKYTRYRDVVEISIGSKKDDKDYIFFVSDNGVGFNMKYKDKLFGVFQRLHHSDEFEGTGIGLANVHRIITRHGGKTWAESEIDKGATFFFSLPR